MSQADEVVVRPLTQADVRAAFTSGNIDLDRFFQRYAGQNQFRHHLGTTWVAVTGATIVGYFTVSAAHLELRDLPETLQRGLPAYPVPVLRLARFAVSQHAQGKGIGRLLLRGVFTLAHRMADEYGCVGVLVDAKPEAAAYYANLGFAALQSRRGALGDRPEPIPMFVSLRDIPKTTPAA